MVLLYGVYIIRNSLDSCNLKTQNSGKDDGNSAGLCKGTRATLASDSSGG